MCKKLITNSQPLVEKNEKMSGPLGGGDFFGLTLYSICLFDRKRKDYISQLTKDLCLYYDYNEYLMTKIMQLFSLDDVRSIIAKYFTWCRHLSIYREHNNMSTKMNFFSTICCKQMFSLLYLIQTSVERSSFHTYQTCRLVIARKITILLY